MAVTREDIDQMRELFEGPFQEQPAQSVNIPLRPRPSQTEKDLRAHVIAAMAALSDLSNATEEVIAPLNKHRLVASLGVGDLLKDLNEAAEKVRSLVGAKLAVEREINDARRLVEELKALKIVNGEAVGKNEGERAAAMTFVLRDDIEYQDLRAKMDLGQSSLQEIDGELSFLKAKETAIKYEIKFKTAQLEFLGAE